MNIYSDIREQQVVETYDAVAALETVKNVRSVTFAYKKQPEQKRFSVIAQKLQDKLPELINVVGLKDEEERLVLNEMGVIPVLWASVPELTAEVEKLKSKK